MTTPLPKTKPLKPCSIDLLPKPFGWVKIPAGKVTLEAGGYLSAKTTFDVPAFEMAKYPITNAHYRLFIAVGGYEERHWWTEVGWAKREEYGWEEPRHWRNSKWNGATYPVVGVSWYEAIAYCQWLSEATGENIMLPTEQQWQRAAQANRNGDDSARAYVWGDNWKRGMCNNGVRPEKSNRITPVTQFESVGNVSPCGVVDLMGNVWEWCLTQYETGSQAIDETDVGILRGGSWFNNFMYYFCTDYRAGAPYSGNYDWGFRVARFD